MKTTTLIAIFASATIGIAGVVQAQTTVTKTTTVETTTYSDGTVTEFDPDSAIVVKTSADVKPVSYRIHQEITYVNDQGEPVKMSSVVPGTVVKVDYVEEDGELFARRVVVPGTPAVVDADAVVEATPARITTEEVESVKIQSTPTGLKATKVVTTTTKDAVVTRLEPGKEILVHTVDSPDVITYRLKDDTVFVTPDEEVVEIQTLSPGTPVTVYYDTTDDDTRIVRKVVVQELIAGPGR